MIQTIELLKHYLLWWAPKYHCELLRKDVMICIVEMNKCFKHALKIDKSHIGKLKDFYYEIMRKTILLGTRN